MEEEDDEDEEDEEIVAESEDEEKLDGIDWDDEEDKKVTVSYACDECDYRWDDVVIKKKGALDDDEPDIICPMCGSMNVTLI
ncbi:MAG: hypothetical protein JW807_02855 [Spirochaetes bacterium]|nr:hypothetical protein [Spirochaetota bacterium]